MKEHGEGGFALPVSGTKFRVDIHLSVGQHGQAGSGFRVPDFGYAVSGSSTRGTSLGGVPREQKMLKGHLPRVIYHQVF